MHPRSDSQLGITPPRATLCSYRTSPVPRSSCEAFVEALRAEGVQVETGVFGAMMEVELVNDGPVTLVIDL